MIEYWKGIFGIQLLGRFHGSCVLKGMIPGVLAGITYISIILYNESREEDFFGHPYAIGVYVGSIAFTIVFRMNNAYGRYWGAAGSVYEMMSKWLDSTSHAGTYHLQQSHYEEMRPPSYYDHYPLNFLGLTRDRERGLRTGLASTTHINNPLAQDWKWDPNDNLQNTDYHPKERSINAIQGKGKFNEDHYREKTGSGTSRETKKVNDTTSKTTTTNPLPRMDTIQESLTINEETATNTTEQQQQPSPQLHTTRTRSQISSAVVNSAPVPSLEEDTSSNDVDEIECHIVQDLPSSPQATTSPINRRDGYGSSHSYTSSGHRYLHGPTKLDGNWSAITAGKPVPPGGFTPPVFLQELCHLSSLLVAVAFSTLRNDIEGAEAPLDAYIPGQPWPEVDSDKLPSQTKRDFTQSRFCCLRWIPSGFMKNLRYFMNLDQTDEVRTAYNAARPFLVLGGVSEGEIKMLQRARGAQAKTELAWSWLSEFMIREHLAGSMGEVHPAIVSRCFQFLSDGMIPYQHARKVMFIPFPFVSAQLAVFFVINLIWAIPVMLTQYVNDKWLGMVLAFFAVTCFSSMHEVARELENPFKNVPNELPLCTLLAQYNEALLTMYYGFHPDHFWNPNDYYTKENSTVESNSKVAAAEKAATAAKLTQEKPKKIQESKPRDDDALIMTNMKEILNSQTRELEELRRLILEVNHAR